MEHDGGPFLMGEVVVLRAQCCFDHHRCFTRPGGGQELLVKIECATLSEHHRFKNGLRPAFEFTDPPRVAAMTKQVGCLGGDRCCRPRVRSHAAKAGDVPTHLWLLEVPVDWERVIHPGWEQVLTRSRRTLTEDARPCRYLIRHHHTNLRMPRTCHAMLVTITITTNG